MASTCLLFFLICLIFDVLCVLPPVRIIPDVFGNFMRNNYLPQSCDSGQDSTAKETLMAPDY